MQRQGGRVIGTSDFKTTSRSHPYVVGSSSGGRESLADFHMAVWMFALRKCSSNASLVGGRDFNSGAFVNLAWPFFWTKHLHVPVTYSHPSCSHTMQQ